MERFYEPVFPQYFDDEPTEPVPGWGVNPLWAGPRMIAVGDDLTVGSGDAKILADAALAQQQASDLAAQMKAGVKANPLYYIGGAAALGLLAFAVAPQGKGIIAGVVGAALGAVGAHFAVKAMTPPGSVAIPGSSDMAPFNTPSTSTPSADTSTPVVTKDSSADTKPITTSSTPNADTPRTVVSAPPAASYADNLKSCQDLVEMGGGSTNLADCMRSGGTPLVAGPAMNSGLVVSPAAAAAMLATQSPGYAAGQALQAQMQAQAAAQAAAQAKAAWALQAALNAAQAQRDGAARGAAAAAAAHG